MMKSMSDVKKFIEQEIKNLNNPKICVTKTTNFNDDMQSLDIDVEIWTNGEYVNAINVHTTGWTTQKFDKHDLSVFKKLHTQTDEYVKKYFSDYHCNDNDITNSMVGLMNSIILP